MQKSFLPLTRSESFSESNCDRRIYTWADADRVPSVLLIGPWPNLRPQQETQNSHCFLQRPGPSAQGEGWSTGPHYRPNHRNVIEAGRETGISCPSSWKVATSQRQCLRFVSLPSVGASQCGLTVDHRTSSKAERIEEYLAIPSLPDLTEEEVKLIDDIGRTHFSHLYVSSRRGWAVFPVDESPPSPAHIRCWITRSRRIGRGTGIPRWIKINLGARTHCTILIAQGILPTDHCKNNNVVISSLKSVGLSRRVHAK